MGSVTDIDDKAKREAAKAADDARRKERERAKKARYRMKKKGGGADSPVSTISGSPGGQHVTGEGGHVGVDLGGHEVDNSRVHLSPAMSPPVSPETAVRIVFEDGVPVGMMNRGGRYRLFNDNAEKELACRRLGVDPNPPKPDPENSDVLSPVVSPRLSPVHHPPEREFEELTLSLGRATVHQVDTVDMSTTESENVSTKETSQEGNNEQHSTSHSDPDLMTQAPAWAVAMERRLFAEVGALREQVLARLDGVAVQLQRVSEARAPSQLPTVKTLDDWMANHEGTRISGEGYTPVGPIPQVATPPTVVYRGWPEVEADGDHPTPVIPAPASEPETTTNDDLCDDVVAGLDLTYAILAAWMLVSGQKEEDITLVECDSLAEVYAYAKACVGTEDSDAAFDLYMHWLSLTDVPAGESPRATHVYVQLPGFPKTIPVEHQDMPELRWSASRAVAEHSGATAA